MFIFEKDSKLNIDFQKSQIPPLNNDVVLAKVDGDVTVSFGDVVLGNVTYKGVSNDEGVTDITINTTAFVTYLGDNATKVTKTTGIIFTYDDTNSKYTVAIGGTALDDIAASDFTTTTGISFTGTITDTKTITVTIA